MRKTIDGRAGEQACSARNAPVNDPLHVKRLQGHQRARHHEARGRVVVHPGLPVLGVVAQVVAEIAAHAELENEVEAVLIVPRQQ